MIAYIKGKLGYRGADHIIAEAGGIGYRVFTPPGSFAGASEGDDITVYTHQHFREDDVSLFGFGNRDQLGIFEMLLAVSGVGPKVALSLVSSMSPAEFCIAVITDDAKALTRAQGIGMKVAQRIVLELKDKVKKEQLPGGSDFAQKSFHGPEGMARKQSEAISAMMVLGYSSSEAYTAVVKIYDDGLSIEEIIKLSLKQMIRK